MRRWRRSTLDESQMVVGDWSLDLRTSLCCQLMTRWGAAEREGTCGEQLSGMMRWLIDIALTGRLRMA